MLDKEKISEVINILFEHEHFRNKRGDPIKINTIKKYLEKSSVYLDRKTIIKICEDHLGKNYSIIYDEKPKLVYTGPIENIKISENSKAKRRKKAKQLNPVQRKNESDIISYENFVAKINAIILLNKSNNTCPLCRKTLAVKEVDVATYIGKPFIIQNIKNYKRIKSLYCNDCLNYFIDKTNYESKLSNNIVYIRDQRYIKPNVTKVLNYEERHRKTNIDNIKPIDPSKPGKYNKHLFHDYASSPDGRI